jgi:predicted metal-dependent enzyme (double-stranded beta helix superfamily)
MFAMADKCARDAPKSKLSAVATVRLSRRKLLMALTAATTQLILAQPASAARRPPSPAPGARKMDIDRFVADCVAANQEGEPQAAVLEVLARALSTPAAVQAAMGDIRQAGITVIHRSKTLTIFNAAWTPQMNLMPHNHRLWADIGIYTGREDNLLWRRTANQIEAFGAKALFEGDTVALPHDVIHSVTNPLLRFTGGIHIYGGDFFDTARSQWNPETLDEEPSDGASIRSMFERENQRMDRCKQT